MPNWKGPSINWPNKTPTPRHGIRKERPRCRKAILTLMAEDGCTLDEMYAHRNRFTGGMLSQLQKMIWEQREEEE